MSAARAVASAEGGQAFTVANVAGRAQVSTATLYKYAGDIEGLRDLVIGPVVTECFPGDDDVVDLERMVERAVIALSKCAFAIHLDTFPQGDLVDAGRAQWRLVSAVVYSLRSGVAAAVDADKMRRMGDGERREMADVIDFVMRGIVLSLTSGMCPDAVKDLATEILASYVWVVNRGDLDDGDEAAAEHTERPVSTSR